MTMRFRSLTWIGIGCLAFVSCSDASNVDTGMPDGMSSGDSTTGSAGEGEEVWGCWRHAVAVGSQTGYLNLEEDGESKARIYFFIGESFYYADFDVEYEVVLAEPDATAGGDGDGDGDDTTGGDGDGDTAGGDASSVVVLLVFECAEVACSELDFDLRCTVDFDAFPDTMSCTQTKGTWSTYPFNWRRAGDPEACVPRE
jgi:hypothetical protein